MTPAQALGFVERHGIVLEAAQGPAPSLATEVLGRRPTGSWWGHPRAKAFFWLTRTVRESPDVLVCRLIDGKITYVHRRLWPPLVRLAREIGPTRLAAVREVHAPSGKHQVEIAAYPKWVPRDVRAKARALGRADAADAISAAVPVSAITGRSTHSSL